MSSIPYSRYLIYPVPWYSFLIVTGVVFAVIIACRGERRIGLPKDTVIDLALWLLPCGIIGARLYYVIFSWNQFRNDWWSVFRIWEGGIAIYGGIIGGVLAAFIVCKVRKMNFWNLFDIASMSLLIGQGIGRWGNFTNQEAFGINTEMPWGMWSEKIADDIIRNQALHAEKGFYVDPDKFVHPTFLYESIWCLLGVLVLYIICRKARKFSGQIALCYGIWYGVERAVVEGLRTDSLYIAGTTIRVSQALSLAIAVVCAILLVALLIKFTKNPKPIDGVDFFLEEELKKEAEAKKNADKETAEESAVIKNNVMINEEE